MPASGLPAPRMSPAGSMLWALIPLFTLGLGTPFVLAWAAHRLRSRGLALSALAALIMMVAALPLSGSPDGSGGSTAAGWFIVALIGGGLTATFVTRPRLVDPGHSSRSRTGPEVRGPRGRLAPIGRCVELWTLPLAPHSYVGSDALKPGASWNVTPPSHESC